MEQIRHSHQWIGKTITHVAESHDCYMLIRFDDGTYSYLQAYDDEKYGAQFDLVEDFDQEYITFSDQTLIDFGFYTPEELTALRDRQEIEEAEQQRNSDLKKLAELKAKYGEA